MSPSLVLDNSLVVAWLFDDQRSAVVNAIEERVATEAVVVPYHWQLELTNVLRRAVRQKRIDDGRAQQFIDTLASYAIDVDTGLILSSAADFFAFSSKLGINAYDAAYVELAFRYQLPLATLDQGMQAAARELKIPLLVY